LIAPAPATPPSPPSQYSPEAAAGWSRWPAPAKLNLFLRILGRRPDGYHDLQTVFRLLDWGDHVELRCREDGRIIRHAGPMAVPEAEDLAVRAGRTLQQATKCPQGADIRVEKRIPIGSGFGGGSSDAATVLVALNAIWGTGLSSAELTDLGRQLGADVPVFVGGHSAWAEGIGERIMPLALPEAWYLLVDPGVHASTAELFAAPELTRQAVPTTMAGFLAGDASDNAFEPVLRARSVQVERAFAALAAVGRPRLTGSGSGVFVEFGSRAAAEAALAAVPDMRAWLARGVSVSPLQDAVEAWRRSSSP